MDGAVVVRLAGELDMSTAAELRRRLLRVVKSTAAPTIVLDLSDVSFIDAHCAGLIETTWADARCRGRQLRVDGLHGIPARVFNVLGLEPIVARRRWEDGPGREIGGRDGGTDGIAAPRSDGGAHEAD
jgi:anti-anti-sigma factor